MATPSDEEVERMRAQVAAADARKAKASRQEVLDGLKPLTDLGVGTDGPLKGSVTEIAAAFRAVAPGMTAVDPNLFNLFSSTAQVVETAHDRVRSLVALNSDPAEGSLTPPPTPSS